MYIKILLASDGSEGALKAAEAAAFQETSRQTFRAGKMTWVAGELTCGDQSILTGIDPSRSLRRIAARIVSALNPNQE